MRLHLFLRWYQNLFQQEKRKCSSKLSTTLLQKFWKEVFVYYIFNFSKFWHSIKSKLNFMFLLVSNFILCDYDKICRYYLGLYIIICEIHQWKSKSVLSKCLLSFYSQEVFINILYNDNNACWWTININIFCHCSTKGKLP